MPPKDFVQPRGGTAALWASRNPVLALRELGVETDTKKMKIGDGVTHWNDLPYITGPVDGDNVSLQVKRDTETNLAASTTPIPDGTLVYNQTTGRMKIGDGETLWPNLPDPGKQFKNVITVAKDGVKGDADFICSDSAYASDAACILDAIDSVSSGSPILFSAGVYTIPAQIIKSGKNIYLVGEGDVTFNVTYDTTYSPALYFSGTVISTTSTISVDANIATNKVTLTDVSGIAAGDLILMLSSDLWCPATYADQNTGELYVIYEINGNVVTLNKPLIRTYTVAKTTVKIYRPITVKIENIKILNHNKTTSLDTVKLQYCKDSKMSKCEIGNSGHVSLMVSTCYNTEISSCYIHDSDKLGEGYGIGIYNGSAEVDIHHNRIERFRHCISAVYDVHNMGLNSGIRIHHNNLMGGSENGMDIIDSHPTTINISILNNEIYIYNGSNGYISSAYADGAYTSEFSHNIVYGGTAVRRRDALVGGNYIISKNTIYNGEIYNDKTASSFKNSMYIEGNILIGGSYGVNARYEPFASLKIVGNYMYNISQMGIYIESRSTTTRSYEVYIHGNYISNVQYNAIRLYKISTVDQNITISNNFIDDVNLIQGQNSAIVFSAISGATISENTIKNTSGYMYASFIESNGCDYNTIRNNDLTQGTSQTLILTGTHDTVDNNTGYKTQNTGTATITSSSTSVTVSHGLAAAPTRVIVTPGGNINCWVVPASITATQFTISSSAPETDTTVFWSAQVV